MALTYFPPLEMSMKFRLCFSYLLGSSIRLFHFLIIGVIATSLVLSNCSPAQALPHSPMAQSGMIAMAQPVAMNHEITVFRSPTCGCCGKWVEHMEAAGFKVDDKITEDVTAVKEHYGLPEDLASCHTAIANGYVIEGHVPAEDVQQLLRDKPNIAGITAPGMPIGSPGMEMGDDVEPYTVFSFTNDGSIETFAEHA